MSTSGSRVRACFVGMGRESSDREVAGAEGGVVGDGLCVREAEAEDVRLFVGLGMGRLRFIGLRRLPRNPSNMSIPRRLDPPSISRLGKEGERKRGPEIPVFVDGGGRGDHGFGRVND
ncbi:hypothetical protein Salat_1709100 [Sesamum alatum]|uniref:Uncharacterized protein n=1 Tax=Sesamum alatum TaxID=300844 RepID=A0AAE1Y7Y2_9LAMI|nr:hypothetical protein Salat_1709100 [Sesamum alatum]